MYTDLAIEVNCFLYRAKHAICTCSVMYTYFLGCFANFTQLIAHGFKCLHYVYRIYEEMVSVSITTIKQVRYKIIICHLAISETAVTCYIPRKKQKNVDK